MWLVALREASDGLEVALEMEDAQGFVEHVVVEDIWEGEEVKLCGGLFGFWPCF